VRVSAIVPNWNRAELLERLLQSVHAQTVRFDELIVVDNGSSDGSIGVGEAFGARVLRLDQNRGFAYAVNRGIETAQSEFVAILNNDVTLDRKWLEELLKTNADFACGLVLSDQDPTRIDGTFDLVTAGGLAWRAGSGESAEDPRWQQPREIQCAPMTAALFHRTVFQRVGLLDESFESYLEDVDFGIRCAMKGIRGRYVPTAIARHQGSSTFGAWHPTTVTLLSRNQVLLISKHFPRHWVRRYSLPAIAGQILWGWSAWRRGKGAAWWQGKREGMMAFRRRVPAERDPGPVFAESRKLLRNLAPNWFWKVNSWLG
jgi:GT2 family glycosyltransferase